MAKRRNALGRGLSALLDDNDSGNDLIGVPNSKAGSVSMIRIDQVETNPFQPRTHFDLVALEELADSIKVQGIIQPITVRKMGKDAFQLISGERRLQASKLAGLEEIPAYVRTADDEQMLEMALIENIQREDLNPIEIALAYKRMIDELSLKQEVLGEKVGKKRATVNNYLRLLKLPPEIQIALRDQKISMGHARALINVEDRDQQLAILRQVLENGLSVRKVEELVRNLPDKKKPGDSDAPKKGEKNIHLVNLEKRLEDKFGNRVYINQKTSGRGDIKINFESTEDLNRLLELLDL